MNTQPTIQSIRQRLAGHQPHHMSTKDMISAAVLVPLLQREELELLLTVRTEEVEHHKGQVAFPGGATEPGDLNIEATALRETREELALPPSSVEVLGRLDDMWTPSGFIVTPVVGFVRESPVLQPQPAEVSEYFTVPLAFFLNEDNGYTKRYRRGPHEVDVWFYEYSDHTVWGLTAFIIRNLRQLLL